MSTSSERVKKWRQETKKRIIESMGGECICCGYKKCEAALELHHINPEDKEFSLGSIRATPKKWTKIVEELRKCVLLCSNCHKEIHSSILELPENYNVFDESYAHYKVKKHTSCEICGGPKKTWNRTCSKKCSGKLNNKKGKVNWDKIDLFKLLKEDNKNLCEIGRMLGVSDNAVRKRAKKIGII